MHFLADLQDYNIVVDRGAPDGIHAVEEDVVVRNHVVALFENLICCRPLERDLTTRPFEHTHWPKAGMGEGET